MFPGLEFKLIQAGMYDPPEKFVKKTFISAFYLTTALLFIVGAIVSTSESGIKNLVFVFPIIFLGTFLYFLKLPDVKILRRAGDINRDIVFATRFIIVELESGIPVYDALANVSKNFKDIGKYFDEIITQVDLGTPLPDAINRAIDFTPSINFRKVLWQILNSLKTGADVSYSLKSVVHQIVREQTIELEEYGRKLNPFAMFYMIIAIIVPTLGTTMLIVFSSFISLNIELPILILMVAFFGVIQFFFLMAIKNKRPSFEL